MAYTTINDPSKYFQTDLHTGDGSGSTETFDGNSNMQPDWLWFKSRNVTGDHGWVDTSRGKPSGNDSFYILKSNSTAAEVTVNSGSDFTSMNSDGYTYGGVHHLDLATNNSQNIVWGWKCNGGTTTSFSASGAQLAGTRQSNTTAGFSIITYTGDGNNNATIPHGLNSAPKFVIIKERGNATNWYVGHDATFTTGEVFLNLTNALAAAFGPFNKTAPGSSNITLGTDGSVNGSSDTYVCYAFAEVRGYSKFGSYTGNGSADGTFVNTGFKPAWCMWKRTDGGSNMWMIMDNKRDTSNVMDRYQAANSNAVEGDYDFVDFLSNGFKFRHTSSHANGDGESYIYMAFAESPFVSSKGTPTTAR